jgi:DNA-binding NarL/FixJ family response regulator
MRPRRVLLVDDLIMVTDTLGLRLSTVPGLVLIGRYRTADADLVRDLPSLRPDITVVDLAQAGAGAEALVRAMRTAWPAGHLLVLTASEDTALAVRAARAGCDAWVHTGSTLDYLVRAVNGVCDGSAWWPPHHLGPVLRALRVDADDRCPDQDRRWRSLGAAGGRDASPPRGLVDLVNTDDPPPRSAS